MKWITGASLGLVLFPVIFQPKLAAQIPTPPIVADLKPIALSFQEMPEQIVNRTYTPAHQLVSVRFINIGNTPVIASSLEECLKLQSRGLAIGCGLTTTALIKNQQVRANLAIPGKGGLQYIPGEPTYQPGIVYTWQFKLPPSTLKPCETVLLHIDTTKALDQYAEADDVFANDKTRLKAVEETAKACQS